jgi:hypothetical protein
MSHRGGRLRVTLAPRAAACRRASRLLCSQPRGTQTGSLLLRFVVRACLETSWLRLV